MKIKVDPDLLPMKAHYFLFNAGTAPVVPFMPTLARQLGFSASIIGIMYGILPVIGMLVKPLFGYIADRYQQHRVIFLVSEIMTAVAFFLIMFVPSIPPPEQAVQFHCHNGASDLLFCADGSPKPLFDMSHASSKYADCRLHCGMQPFMWDIVCENWFHGATDKPEACGNAGAKTSALQFRTSIDPTVTTDNCLILIQHPQAIVDGHNVTMFCPANKAYFNASCSIACDPMALQSVLDTVHKFNATAAAAPQAAANVTQASAFWEFFGLLIISWIGMAVVVSIGDALCFSILRERAHLYGNQRLYGSIGWGIFSIVAGVLVDKMSDGAVKDYTVVFWMTAVIMCFDVFVSSKLKHRPTPCSPNMLAEAGRLFLSIKCVVFFLWCVFIGLCTALIWNFLFLHLEDLAGQVEGGENSIKTLEGLVMGIQCFGGELPFFFLSGWILRKIGHVNAMSLVLFGFGVRFILYSMLQDPWYVLPIELMNGITFGIFYATMTSYASTIAPAGSEATLQGLVGAIFEGVGVGVGSPIAGMLFDKVGGGHTFEIFGMLAFMAFLAHVIVQMYLKSRSTEDRDSGLHDTIKYLNPTDAIHIINENDRIGFNE